MKNRLAGTTSGGDWKREYFSIPNLMGYFRILLVPVFAYLYLHAETFQENLVAALVLGISALTDCFDGKIARRFNMVTEWGKFVDPLADKLTQGVTAICLTTRYPMMIRVVAVLLLKDLTLAVLGAISLKRGQKLDGAAWCGKIATVVLDCAMIILLLLPDIGYSMADILMYVCILFMIYALVGYILIYRRMWLALEQKKKRGWKVGVLSGSGVVVLYLVYLLLGSTLPVSSQPALSEDYQSSVSLADYRGDGSSQERAALIMDNQEALEMRLRMIAGAQERVILASFDFEADEGGLEILAALYDAAQRGVQVQVLADGLRAMINMEGNPYFYALSTLPNAEVRIYNAINPLCPWTLMGRMHDKYVIVDDDLYLLGGRNTRRFFLGEHEGAKNYDWDVLVTHDGDEDGSLSQLETYFYSIWNSENATVFHNQLSLGQTPSVNRAAAKLQDIHDAQVADMPEVFQSYDYQQVTVPVEQVTLLSGQTQILSKEPQVFYTLCQLMGQATEDVTIHTPYIACNEYMLEELSKLSDNGAEIRLMTNSPANNGNLFGAAFYYSEDKQALLDAGFHLMEYDGGYSYHGKCIAVDDDLSMVGSFNLDMRSTYLDTELMLVIDSQEFNSWLREDMQTYEETALQVVDADTVLAPEGQEVQELSGSRQFMFSVVNALLGWAKFLV